MTSPKHTRLPALLLALLLAGVLMLTACNSDEEDSSSSSEASSSSSESTSDSGSDSASGSSSSSSSAPVPTVELHRDIPYRCLNEARYTADRTPYLVFTEDAFTFTFNTGEGVIGDVTGSYTLSGTALTLVAGSYDYTDFLGEGTAQFSFTVQDEYRVVYNGESFGLTRNGDVFEIEGAPPYVEPEPEPESSSAPASSPSSAASASA